MTNKTKKYKKVNCAPLSKNNTVKNSCYNKKTLDLIKKSIIKIIQMTLLLVKVLQKL